jgi:ribonuclease D
LDTEFLRERTFFPKLCLLQLGAGAELWCVDALRPGALEPLVEPLTAAAAPKLIHAARQDLEAFYLSAKRIISPVFDTQIAAACVGLKPQIGYAELVKILLDVNLSKGQTRTDWSRRPLSAAQLDYAAHDVMYLEEIAARLTERLRALGRERWVREDCAALEHPQLYEPDPDRAWERLRGIAKLRPRARTRARALAVWRERTARERDLPRSWIIPDEAIFELAESNPTTIAALRAARALPRGLGEERLEQLLEALGDTTRQAAAEQEPEAEQRPTAEQKLLALRLNQIVDTRAAELGVSPELLAPRGELKALALGRRSSPVLTGWRRDAVGELLLPHLG